MGDFLLYADILFLDSDIRMKADGFTTTYLNENSAHFIEGTLSLAPTLPSYWIYKSEVKIVAVGISN